MAKGSISAQSSQRLPGNSHKLVSQARLTPKSSTPKPTPKASSAVLASSTRILVAQRCDHISWSIFAQLSSRTVKGRSTKAAIGKASPYQERAEINLDTSQKQKASLSPVPSPASGRGKLVPADAFGHAPLSKRDRLRMRCFSPLARLRKRGWGKGGG